MGYYIAYHDLSRSTITREKIIRPIYYPIFHDTHNWKEPVEFNPWMRLGDMPEKVKKACELMAIQTVLEKGTYYSDLRARTSLFNFQGRSWYELSQEEREEFGRQRAESHNKQILHETSFLENCEIMRDYIHLLHLYNILPAVVVTPFTASYNKYVDSRFKDVIKEMLESIPEEVHYVDINENDLFDDKDFIDTDHLNRHGAMKVSYMLNEMFAV